MSHLELRVVNYATARSIIQSIRQVVFQVEQQVDPTLDFDGLDETAIHLIAWWDSQPVGTLRIRYLNPELAKIERVAVLSVYRRQGIGKALVEKAIAFLDDQHVPHIKVNAQLSVKDFYHKLGFEPRGEIFSEAGLLHIEMWRTKQFGRS